MPPLAIDGPALTIRKFKKDKLTLEQLVKFGAISPEGAEILQIIGRVRCNVLISGGTGSGKTTLLNCLTQFIEHDERVITCEDAAELQLQQPHVVRLETRPPNIEGEGQVTMRELVRNCLRMRPERIIVGEVRGPEAFDLLQAMNTGHDGSMGTLHANNPREALSRCESMITMGGFSLPSRTIREMICASIDVIVQAARLRDGSRRITHITEVMGMEGDTIITQDVFLYDMIGEDANGKIIGTASLDRHRTSALLGTRAILRRREAARGRARRRRSRRATSEERADEHPNARTGLSRLHRHRRPGLGLHLSDAVGREEGRVAPRLDRAARTRAARQADKNQRSRREQVEGSLKELEARRQKEKSVPLAHAPRAGRAELDDRRNSGSYPAFSRSRSFVAAFWIGGGLLGGVGMAFAAGFGLPRWMLGYLKKRREKAFLKALPDAVDVIVRGIKAGLPLFESIKVVAADAPEPLKSEFLAIIETQTIGMPLGEACARLFERMPVPEANFFGIVIAIQQKSGGNLSEALGNLSKVLRDRKKMAEKIQAMSMEAKASAGIIGSLPPIVMLLVWISTPDYISLLWTHPTGQFMLVAASAG